MAITTWDDQTWWSDSLEQTKNIVYLKYDLIFGHHHHHHLWGYLSKVIFILFDWLIRCSDTYCHLFVCLINHSFSFFCQQKKTDLLFAVTKFSVHWYWYCFNVDVWTMFVVMCVLVSKWEWSSSQSRSDFKFELKCNVIWHLKNIYIRAKQKNVDISAIFTNKFHPRFNFFVQFNLHFYIYMA